MPVLYIITGSNGAGKSSVGFDYVPDHLKESIFDGDKLFMTKRREYWVSGIKSHKECKKLAAEFVEKSFEKLVKTSLAENFDFAYEGHFTTNATWRIPEMFKNSGYQIHLIFFGLTDVTLSEARVITRAKEGGHNVDPLTLRNNFYGNLEKLNKFFTLFNTVTIVDTSTVEHVGLVILENGQCISSVKQHELPHWVTNNLPDITRTITEA